MDSLTLHRIGLDSRGGRAEAKRVVAGSHGSPGVIRLPRPGYREGGLGIH